MIVHCNMKVRSEIIWFLYPTQEYTDRKIEITHCPVCGKLLARYSRQGILTRKILSDTYSKGKAEVFLESMRKDREYTSWDLLFNSGMHGFRYGETKIVKRDGKKYLVDKSVDFHGNKEIVREKLL